MVNLMNLYQHKLQSFQMQSMINITELINQDIQDSDIQEGICVVCTLNNGTGITISDRDSYEACTDMIYGYAKAFPIIDAYYHHIQGNSHAYMKSSAVGSSQTYMIHEGKLLLGDKQAIYFCEFDGPKEREMIVKLLEG